MTPPLLSTSELVKDYVIGGETVHAVNNVSLSIARGEFVAIMGASGSGQIDVYEYDRVSGCADIGDIAARWDRYKITKQR